MLTKELLAARRYRGKIYPRFVDPRSSQNLEIAERVLAAFREGLGATREELRERLEQLEDHKTFKLVRGLAQLLERRCLFEPRAPVEPRELRRWLFRRGVVLTPEERRARLEEAARAFGCSVEELERAFWADREENHVLRGFLPRFVPRDAAPTPTPTPGLSEEPEALLQQYNLSLAQTLLFDALELKFEVSERYQPIFRAVKRLGLMYEAVEEVPGRVRVRVDGPASLFKETTKYGTALAKLLPALLSAREFRLEALIKDGKRKLTFELDASKRSLFPELSDGEPEEERFDSAVEADFYRRIRAVMRDWRVLREPAILKAGPHVFIPDFGFERRDSRCYLEIVGFWTPEYLQKKLQKLREARPEEPLLLAVDRNLRCTEDELRATGHEFFLYEKRLPLEPIVRRLLTIAEQQAERDRERLRAEPLALDLQGDRIPLEGLAERHEVDIEALREHLERRLAAGDLPGYRLVSDALVSERALARLKAELDALAARTTEEGLGWEEVEPVLRRYGLGESALEAVGYGIERASLLEARVVRRA